MQVRGPKAPELCIGELQRIGAAEVPWAWQKDMLVGLSCYLRIDDTPKEAAVWLTQGDTELLPPGLSTLHSAQGTVGGVGTNGEGLTSDRSAHLTQE